MAREDLLAAAMREVTEETGLRRLRPLTDGIFSLECLAVEGHEKRGRYVPSHVHLNVTYLLQSEDAALREKPDENSGVEWMRRASAARVKRAVDAPVGLPQAHRPRRPVDGAGKAR